MMREAGDKADLELVLDAAVRRAAELLGAVRGALFLSDGSGLFVGRAAHPASDRDAVRSVTRGDSADGLAQQLLTRRAIAVERATVGAPLINGADVVGLLFLDAATRDDSPVGHEALATFARLAGQAIAQACRAQELQARVAKLEQATVVLRRSAVVEGHFARLSDGGTDPQSVAALASRLTEKPCAIHAADGRCVASASPGGPEDPMPRVLEPHVVSKPDVAAALDQIPVRGSGFVGPFPRHEIMHRCLVSPIVVEGAVWGHIAIMELWRRVKPTDKAVIEAAAQTLGVELRLERHGEGRWDQLVAADARAFFDAHDVERRAIAAGIRHAADHVVCLVQRHGGGPLAPDMTERLRNAFDATCEGTRSFACAVGSGTIALVVEQEPAATGQLTTEVNDALQLVLRTLVPDRLVATISSPVRDVHDLARACSESRHLLSCLTQLQPKGVATLTPEDVGVGRVLLGTTDPRALDQFTHDVVGPLVARDGRYDDLLHTLYAFLHAGRSPRTTGHQLGVHENTVRYRLARVAELTGLDVAANAEHQLSAHIATLVLRLRGQVPGYDVLGHPTRAPTHGSGQRAREAGVPAPAISDVS
jgi:GAF domain-containing protein